MITEQDVNSWFNPLTRQGPSEEVVNNLLQLNSYAKALVHLIMQITPQCADQSAAIRKVREAVMTTTHVVLTEGDK